MPSIPTLLIQRRLRWLGHVHRMEPDRLPRQVLYRELWEGARRVADHSFALRMFASVTNDSLNSIPIPGRSSHKTAPPGVTVWRREHSGRRRRPGPRRQSSGQRERNDKEDCHSRIRLLSHSRACWHWCADHRLSETRMPYYYKIA